MADGEVGSTLGASAVAAVPEPRARTAVLASPWTVVLGAAGAGAAVFSLLTLAVVGPIVYLDELIYMDAATSLAAGDGLAFRTEDYGYGPVYPVLVSIVLALVGGRLEGYHVALALNAVVIASAVVPLFLVARRVMSPRRAAWTAASCLLLPSTFYAAYLMTDALGYVVTLWAVLVIQRALEHPSVGRQVVALGIAGSAVLVRPQLVLLVPTYLLAALLYGRLRGQGLRGALRAHLLLTAACAAGLLVAVGAGVSGRGSALLGSYGVLWRGVDVVETARWVGWHVLDVTLYLWILPALLLPAALLHLWRRGRRSPQAASTVAVTSALTVCTLLLVGVFSATPWAESRLHDRYLIFLFPLFVIALVAWVGDGAPVVTALTVAACVGAGLLVLLVPFASLVVVETPNVFDGVGTTPWAVLGEIVGVDDGALSSRTLLLLATGLAIAAALLLRSKRRTVALVVAGGLVAATAATQWIGAIAISDRGTFVDGTPESVLWVDAVAGERVVTTLFLGTEACNDEWYLRAQLTTEFFNASVGPLVSVAGPYASDRWRIREDGVLVDQAGAPVRADLVLAFPGLDLRGDVLARGTTRDLAVWRVDGPVQVVGGPASVAAACPKV